MEVDEEISKPSDDKSKESIVIEDTEMKDVSDPIKIKEEPKDDEEISLEQKEKEIEQKDQEKSTNDSDKEKPLELVKEKSPEKEVEKRQG